MKIYIAGDHAGYTLKTALIEQLRTFGHEVEDLGADTLNPEDDYPDFITPCAQRVAAECRENSAPSTVFGIVIGGSGQGEAMAANRVLGARAAVFYGKERAVATLEIEGGDSEDGFDPVRLARRHNDANILSLGARFISGTDAVEAVRVFLETPFSGKERHSRRLAKF
jgi:ribose 5-phosphate isomerase B